MLRFLRRNVVEHTRQTNGQAIVQRWIQQEECRACLSTQVELRTADAAETNIRREAAASARGIIKLNIGGVKHTTSRATLTAVPGTYFTALFNGDFTEFLTDDGELFVDRQGKCFEHVLQYLRAERFDRAFQLPESLHRRELAALTAEAKFYNLASFHDSLRDMLKKPPPVMEHKFHPKDYYDTWEEHGKQVEELLRQGWELRSTSMSAAHSTGIGVTRLCRLR